MLETLNQEEVINKKRGCVKSTQVRNGKLRHRLDIKRLLLTEGSITKVTVDILRDIRATSQLLGCQELSIKLKRAIDLITNPPIIKTPVNESAPATVGINLIKGVFHKVASELQGEVSNPMISSNKLVAELRPILVENGRFSLDSYQLKYAVALLTQGKDIDFTLVNKLAKYLTVKKGGYLTRRRTTITVSNPIYGLENRVRTYIYTVKLSDLPQSKSRIEMISSAEEISPVTPVATKKPNQIENR